MRAAQVRLAPFHLYQPYRRIYLSILPSPIPKDPFVVYHPTLIYYTPILPYLYLTNPSPCLQLNICPCRNSNPPLSQCVAIPSFPYLNVSQFQPSVMSALLHQAVEAALTNIEHHLTHLGQVDVSLAPKEQLALASLSEPAFIDNLIQTFADKIAQALLNQTSSYGSENPYQLLKGSSPPRT